jgi:tetratricopeptide (TPR) repeat protein
MKAAYKQLVEEAEYERPTLLHPYGASNRTKFFAVATECFFLEPAALREQHPAVYEMLARWYRQDPAERKPDAATLLQARAAEDEYTRQALEERREAIAGYTSIIERVPDEIDARWLRAGMYLELQEWAKAFADYDAAIQQTTGVVQGLAYYERGRAYPVARAYERAIDDFTTAIRRTPDFAAAYWGRGAAHSARACYEGALADLSRALQLDPKDDTALLERAVVHAEMGRHDKALRDLARALRLAPRSAEAYATRAWVRIALGQYDQAIADCEIALRLDPRRPTPYKHRGVARYHQGAFDQALADLDEALRLDPRYIGACRARADVHCARGNHEEARRDRDRADELEREPAPI